MREGKKGGRPQDDDAVRLRGWMFRTRSGAVAIDPQHQKTIDMMFRWLIEDGLSAGAIADRLHDNNVLTFGRGVPWDRQSVVKFFHDTALVGAAVRGVQTVPAAVSLARWEHAAAQLKSNKAKRQNASNLFAGRLFCSECGEAVRMQTRNGKSVLRCSKPKCNFEPMPYEVVERSVLFWLEYVYGLVGTARLGDLLDRKTAIEDRRIQCIHELAELKGYVRQARPDCTTFAQMLEDDVLPLESEMQQLAKELTNLEGELLGIEAFSELAQRGRLAADRHSALCASIGRLVEQIGITAAWESGPVPELWTTNEEAEWGHDNSRWRRRAFLLRGPAYELCSEQDDRKYNWVDTKNQCLWFEGHEFIREQ